MRANPLEALSLIGEPCANLSWNKKNEKKKMRIAIIEDNPNVANGIAYRLQDRGHATDILHDGDDADLFLRDDGNDLVIIDINLPGRDGLSVLAAMRARGDDRPVLLLTARDRTVDRVAGLDAGADDYLVKPFEMDELEARLRAMSRRAPIPISREMKFGRLAFDPDSRRAEADGMPLDLRRRELALLEAFLRSPGRVVFRHSLLDSIYGAGADVEDNAIEVIVSRLRKKLAPIGLEIKARRGLGYELIDQDARQ